MRGSKPPVASDLLDTEKQKARRTASERRVAALGEPWISYFAPSALAAEAAQPGFSSVRDFAPDEANKRYFEGRPDGLRIGASTQLMALRV